MKDAIGQPIYIAMIHGSVRPHNFTGRALALVADEAAKHDDVHVDLFDPAQLNLPLPGVTPTTDQAAQISQLRGVFSRATGVVLATPEYHGSYSSVIKLVIDNLDFPSVLAGKPVGLLGVAAGQIGAIKALEHLRSVCSHIGSVVLPGPVSVAGVQSVFDDEGRCLDAKVESRIRRCATNLIDYIHHHVCPKAALEAMARAK